MGSQPVSESTLVWREMLRSTAFAHAKLVDRFLRAGLSDAPRLLDGLFQIFAEIASQ
jgi:hypothetical protein